MGPMMKSFVDDVAAALEAERGRDCGANPSVVLERLLHANSDTNVYFAILAMILHFH
jgi:hypothetical protein